MTANGKGKGKITPDENKVKIAVSATASAVNLALGIVKLYAGVFTNSISILGDGVNNFGDVFSNAGAAAGFAVENKKPTPKFPFGYGRVEYVVSFVMAIIVVVVGCVFAYTALDRLFYRQIVTFAWTQFWIVFATIFVKVALAVAFGLLRKKFPSEVLKAQQFDSILDSLITTFALLGLFLYRYISFPVDAVIALAISVALIAASVKMLVAAFGKLMGAFDGRADGLRRLSEAQKGVKAALVRFYDYGRHSAEANVALLFEDDADERVRSAAEEKIAAVAAGKGIKVTFVGYDATAPSDTVEEGESKAEEGAPQAFGTPSDEKEEQ